MSDTLVEQKPATKAEQWAERIAAQRRSGWTGARGGRSAPRKRR